MELWDAYDRNLNKIEGLTLIRGEERPKDVFILVCNVVVRHTDGMYLLMRRSPNKTFAGMWELTAGGAAQKGEDAETGASRELFEETGISSGELSHLGTVINERKQNIHADYLFITDVDKDSIKLLEGETDAYKWVTREELLNLSPTEIITPLALMKEFIYDLNL